MVPKIMLGLVAFAATATSASAFTGDMFKNIDLDLSETQLAALHQAHELRVDGADRTEIRAVLDEAGLNAETMKGIRTAVHGFRVDRRDEVKAAVLAGDYDAFIAAIDGSRMEDKITSEADFDKFVEAHELREAGDIEGAREIMIELGFHGRNGDRPDHGERGERGEHRGELQS